MTFLQWSYLAMAATLLLLATAIPLAVVALRHEHRLKRDALLTEIVTIARERAREATQTGEIMAITGPFIQQNVTTSKFGDRRRVTAPLTDLIRPETTPIPLPNEHVPVD